MKRKKLKGMLSENDKTETKSTNNEEQNQVRLSAPWSVKPQYLRYNTHIDTTNIGGFNSDSLAEDFIRNRTRLHELYIREQEKTKRISLLLSSFLILSAGSIVIFAPAGREHLSYWIGASLVIFAAGVAGYRRVWGKTKYISFGADQDTHELS